MVDMLIVRGDFPQSRSGRYSASWSTGYTPLVDSSTPPARALAREFPWLRVAPVAGKCRQTGDRAHCIAAAASTLHAVIEPYHRRARFPVRACQRFDFCGRNAADRSNARRIELRRAQG